MSRARHRRRGPMPLAIELGRRVIPASLVAALACATGPAQPAASPTASADPTPSDEPDPAVREPTPTSDALAEFDPAVSPDPPPPLDAATRDACLERYRVVPDGQPPEDVTRDLAAGGDCLWSAGAVGVAIAVWNALVVEFPESDEARDALVKSARAYDAIDRRSEAARRYERYGSRYPKAFDAADALRRAACLWGSLGDVTGTERAVFHLKRLHGVAFDAAQACGPLLERDDVVSVPGAR